MGKDVDKLWLLVFFYHAPPIADIGHAVLLNNSHGVLPEACQQRIQLILRGGVGAQFEAARSVGRGGFDLRRSLSP